MIAKNHDSQEYAVAFSFIDLLIERRGLQLVNNDRLNMLAHGGIIGCVCSDGDYSVPLEIRLREASPRQHLLKLHGSGFVLGLDPSRFSGTVAEYIRSAQLTLKTDLREAYTEFGKGTTILLIAHGPHCGKAAKLAVSLPDMIKATMQADNIITSYLGVSENIVLPMLLVDRTPEVSDILMKKVELYVIKNAAWDLITQWQDQGVLRDLE